MGSRYGLRHRKVRDEILHEKQGWHECPKCGKKKVKTKSNYLWQCNSCKALFAGGAYTPFTDIGTAALKMVKH